MAKQAAALVKRENHALVAASIHVPRYWEVLALFRKVPMCAICEKEMQAIGLHALGAFFFFNFSVVLLFIPLMFHYHGYYLLPACVSLLCSLFDYVWYMRGFRTHVVKHQHSALPETEEDEAVDLATIEKRVTGCIAALRTAYGELVGKKSKTRAVLERLMAKGETLRAFQKDFRKRAGTSPFKKEMNQAQADADQRLAEIRRAILHLETLIRDLKKRIASRRRGFYRLRRTIGEYRVLQAYYREAGEVIDMVRDVDVALLQSAEGACACVEDFSTKIRAILDATVEQSGDEGALNRELAAIETLLEEAMRVLPEEGGAGLLDE